MDVLFFINNLKIIIIIIYKKKKKEKKKRKEKPTRINVFSLQGRFGRFYQDSK